MKVYDLAYGRAGDKGDIINVSVIARNNDGYQKLKSFLTAEKVKKAVHTLVTGEVKRYELDNIDALNFVLYGALAGGATQTHRLDALGKSLAGIILYIDVE